MLEWRALWLEGRWNLLAPPLFACARAATLPFVMHEDARDDVAQETLIRCWKRTNVPSNPHAFARLTARRLSLDFCNWGSNVRERRDDAAELAYTQAGEDRANPLEEVIRRSERLRIFRAVRDSIETLPDDQYAVMHAHYVEGKSFETIAAEFAVSRSALEMRAFRARQHLAPQLQELQRELAA